jgi:MFS transporter, DHA1 family, tetracycline resistance protein
MKGNKASLSVIFATVFIDLLGFGILIPILPTFGSKQLGISNLQIGLTVAVFSLMQFLFNPIMGRLSDKYGRRPVILVSLSMTITSYIIFSVTNSFFLLIVSRILAGLGGSNIGAAQAYIADITPKHERAKGMGIIGAAFGLGFVFGPMVGGVLSKFGYHVVGLGAAAFSLMAFLFALFFLPESNTDKKTARIKLKLFELSFAKKVLSHPELGILIVFYFIVIFSMANIFGTLSLLGYKVFHFSDQQNGYIFGIMGVVGAAIQGGLIKKLSKKYSERFILMMGALFMMVGLAFLPYERTFFEVAVVVAIYGIGSGILQPIVVSMVSKFAPEGEQGAVLGLNQSIASFARVLGPIWGGFSFDYFGYQFPFITGAAFTFIAFLIAFFLLKGKKTENV